MFPRLSRLTERPASRCGLSGDSLAGTRILPKFAGVPYGRRCVLGPDLTGAAQHPEIERLNVVEPAVRGPARNSPLLLSLRGVLDSPRKMASAISFACRWR